MVDLFQFFSLQTRARPNGDKWAKWLLDKAVNLPNATALYRRKCWLAANRRQAPSSLTLCVRKIRQKWLVKFRAQFYLQSQCTALQMQRKTAHGAFPVGESKSAHVPLLLTFHEFIVWITEFLRNKLIVLRILFLIDSNCTTPLRWHTKWVWRWCWLLVYVFMCLCFFNKMKSWSAITLICFYFVWFCVRRWSDHWNHLINCYLFAL